MKGNVLIVMVGPPGCGKSWMASKLSILTGFPIVSSDAVRGDIYGDESIQGDPEQVFTRVLARLKAYGSEKRSCILDATNCNAFHRVNLVQCFKDLYDHVIGIVYDGDLRTCLNRNSERDRNVPEKVIERMYDQLHGKPPVLSEGFSDILSFKEVEEEVIEPIFDLFQCSISLFNHYVNGLSDSVRNLSDVLTKTMESLAIFSDALVEAVEKEGEAHEGENGELQAVHDRVRQESEGTGL